MVPNGILLVNKPEGISSFRVVSRVRGIIKSFTGNKVKVGHGGTLDPLASGLLIIAVGKHTKQLSNLIKSQKTYVAVAKLGEISSTGDREGEIKRISEKKVSFQEINDVVKKFEGEILQTPPAFSAVKINGQRAYKLARKGIKPEIQPKKVTVYNVKVIDYAYPYLKFETTVSGGTYIRSLIEDIGNDLDCGAYMYELLRTKIGQYDINESIKLEDLSYPKITSHLLTLVN